MSLSIRLANENDKDLPRIDFSQANELFTCPFKGNLKYSLNKNVEGKAKSLELGSLAHDCFAGIRLWWLYNKQNVNEQLIKDKCNSLGLVDITEIGKGDEDIPGLSAVVHNIISESKYQDDPEDKKRTKENLMISMFDYIVEFIELMKTEEVWFDKDKLGVEVKFELVINELFVFIGRIDGIHKTRYGGAILPVENKTSSLINENWLEQWGLSNQIQGYCISTSFYTELDCNIARVIGLQIPKGRMAAYQTSLIHKHNRSVDDWFLWMSKCVELKTKHIESCIKNKSSCYNYFRMCDFANICDANSNEEQNRLIEELPNYEWNPIKEDV